MVIFTVIEKRNCEMERIYIDKNSKLHKIMALSSVVPPINISPVSLYNHPRRSSGFDLLANSGILNSLENLDSPIVRHYRSGSPKSPIVFRTPVKVMEDVVVMDEVLAGPVSGGRVRSLSMTDSGGSSSGGKGFYKMEICRSWEDFGTCCYGAKCQFAHGKEELRVQLDFLTRAKHRFASHILQGHAHTAQNNSPASGIDSPFTVTSSTPRTVSQSDSPASATDSPVSVIPCKIRIVSPVKLENAMNSSKNGAITFAGTDWSPLDDGIEVVLPCSSSTDKPLRKEVDAYINSVLYGSSERKTLPVFAVICRR